MESKWEGSEKEGRSLASLPVILALGPDGVGFPSQAGCAPQG